MEFSVIIAGIVVLAVIYYYAFMFAPPAVLPLQQTTSAPVSDSNSGESVYEMSIPVVESNRKVLPFTSIFKPDSNPGDTKCNINSMCPKGLHCTKNGDCWGMWQYLGIPADEHPCSLNKYPGWSPEYQQCEFKYASDYPAKYQGLNMNYRQCINTNDTGCYY